MIYISKYITFEEATRTNTGLPNIPTDEEIEKMQYVAQKTFDRVREHFNKPIRVNSFFRSQKVNEHIKGAYNSQHTSGEAIDMDGDTTGVSNKAIFDYIKDNLDYDQLIWEFGTEKNPDWVHVSLKAGMNRRQLLRAYKDANGRTKYMPYR